ncbi:cell division protein SepF [Tetragenococcus halophilus subsp. flandriensis]|uniref:cell division protein SepF n=1 Tax=Tetragenococcus halophilus TaxID=51669 RepID=UPI0023E917B7|nr:cell division protein SepF [Tetragenococcus halophilus]GMA07044.1 cell division protein SepF [Tetragenococcus halophilus subsp. flandriensis]
MSFMEKVSNFFGLEDEEYTDSYQTGQNKSVAPQQSSAAPVNKAVKSQAKKSQPQASNGPAVRKPAQTKTQAKKQVQANSRTTKTSYNEQSSRQQAPNRSDNNVVAMKANQVKQTQQSQSGKIMIIEPRAYSEAMTIAKHVIGGESVLVNFRLIEEHQARRIVDFLTGTVYAEDGDIKRVADEIFLCTPKEVEIDGTAQSLVESNLFDL